MKMNATNLNNTFYIHFYFCVIDSRDRLLNKKNLGYIFYNRSNKVNNESKNTKNLVGIKRLADIEVLVGTKMLVGK